MAVKTVKTIHKKNEFIRGTDDLSVMAKRALNTVYWAYQKHDLYKHDRISLKFSTLREMMGLKNNNDYVADIKNAMLELKKPIELNNFYHPIQETTYTWYATSFVNDVGFVRVDEVNKKGEWVCVVEVGNLCKYIMQQKTNFTMLDLMSYTNKFRTKHGMKVYEYLKSFSGYGYIDITHHHFMKLLNLDENSKYKYYGNMTILLERILNDIATKSDLTQVKLKKNPALKSEKKFRIIVNPKSKKQVDSIEAKSVLSALIKRF